MIIQQDKNKLSQSNLSFVHELISKGEYKEALTGLDKLTQSYPNDPNLYFFGGNCYIAMQSFNQAILCYQEAIKLKPDFAEAYSNLGICFREIGKMDESIFHTRKAIKLKPDFAAAHNNLGICFFESSRLNEAHLSYQRALKLKPDFAAAHNNIANIFRHFGQLNEAIASFKKAIELNPDGKSAYDSLGAVYIELGRVDEAKEFFAKSSGDNKDFKQGLLMLENKNFTQAVKLFERSQHADWQDKVLECHYRNSEFDLFKEKLLKFSNNREHIRRTVAALSAHYAQNFKIKDPYNFCPSPLNFVCHEQIPELLENNQHLIKELIEDIKTASVLKRKYQYLFKGSSGEQSGGHLFRRPEKSFKKLSDALIKTINGYYLRYQNEDNEFIRLFPKDISFSSAWYVKMQSGGYLSSHIHEEGWISGAVYLSIPKDSGPDGQEGAIELSSDGDEYPRLHDEFEKKVILPNVGDVIFFPSSVFHRTIPFNSKEERICIAFDVKM